MVDGFKKKFMVVMLFGVYLCMQFLWKMIDVFLGGMIMMCVVGKEYFFQYDNEINVNYEFCFEWVVLFNMMEQILDILVGKLFWEQIVLGEDVDVDFEELFEDIDMQGINLQLFCWVWFCEGWVKGFFYVLVDYFIFEEKVDVVGVVVVWILVDDRVEGMCLYWVYIKFECFIVVYVMMVNGKEVLIYVCIKEIIVEWVGWEEVEIEWVCVLEFGIWQVWKLVDEKKDEWVIESEGIMILDFIFFVMFYVGKCVGLMDVKFLLIDLVYLNVEYWQFKSDQCNVFIVLCFFILVVVGVFVEQKVIIGFNNFFIIEDVQGKWYYVEYMGVVIVVGQIDLEVLEDQMVIYGVEYMCKQLGDEMVIGCVLDLVESLFYLVFIVYDFQDCVELVMKYMVNWFGKDDGGLVQVDFDVDFGEVDVVELDILNKVCVQWDIFCKIYLGEFQKCGILVDDFDEEQDVEFFEEEVKNMMGDMFGGGNGMGLLGQQFLGNQLFGNQDLVQVDLFILDDE